jgi:hypothetical protein
MWGSAIAQLIDQMTAEIWFSNLLLFKLPILRNSRRLAPFSSDLGEVTKSNCTAERVLTN